MASLDASELAGEKKEEAGQESEVKATSSGKRILLNYKPPLRGKPMRRIGGATRGIGDESLFVVALSPAHTGLTTTSQPSLFWYVSEPVSIRVEITINDESSVRPVLEKTLIKPAKAGIQRLELSDLNIRLLPGIEYQWFIAIVVDPEHRSKDIVDTAIIQVIERSEELSQKLAGVSGIEVPAAFAEEGIWYDALAEISDLIDKNPDDQFLREQRALLLKQAGLHTVADFEKSKN
jgi:hypothetical protein